MSGNDSQESELSHREKFVKNHTQHPALPFVMLVAGYLLGGATMWVVLQ